MTGPTRSRRLVAALAAATTAAVLLVSCGVPIDDSPRAISRTSVAGTEPPARTPTTSASPTAAEVTVFYLRGDRLEAQRYPVEGEPTLRQALQFVLSPPAASTSLTSAIPPGTELLNVRVSDHVARIDLTAEIGDISGPPQKQAFAQLVFTALAFSDITSVRFRVEGEPVAAPTDNSNLDEVRASDYDPPLNPR